MITGAQIKAARELLGWARNDLAKKSRILTANMVMNAEDDAPGTKPPTEAQWQAMRDTLEAAGVEFTEGEPGVRLRATPGRGTS